MSYGVPIDSGVDINRVNVYNLFTNYFNNPKMAKVKDLMGGLYQVFGCKVKTLLARDIKYLLVTVPRSKLVGIHIVDDYVYLESLEWSTFETRTLYEELPVPMHSYNKQPLNNAIEVVQKTQTEYIYNCRDFGLTVKLVYGKNQTRPYSDRGTLGLALETFNSMISIT